MNINLTQTSSGWLPTLFSKTLWPAPSWRMKEVNAVWDVGRAEWGQVNSRHSCTPVRPCYHGAWYSFLPSGARACFACTWGALRRAGGIWQLKPPGATLSCGLISTEARTLQHWGVTTLSPSPHGGWTNFTPTLGSRHNISDPSSLTHPFPQTSLSWFCLWVLPKKWVVQETHLSVCS